MVKKSSKSFCNELQLPKPLNLAQRELVHSILNNQLTIVTGPAGTGKSFVTSQIAGYLYKHGNVKKIIITRPNIACGKSLGFFPGLLEEKMSPWVVPIINTLEDYLSKGAVETMVKSGSIEVVPFETIRGRSWDNSFIILDEAQNTTKEEIKAFVTRIGMYSICVINGDCTQSDIKGQCNNGLNYISGIINNSFHVFEGLVGIVKFTSKDVIRSGLCQLFVEAFEKELDLNK